MTPLVKDIIMSSTRMPALFLGHGSPMNVLEDNLYTRSWQKSVSYTHLTLPTNSLVDDIATPASNSGGFGSLVYPWNRSDRDGDAAHDS